MTAPFMRAYTELLVRTCHRRGAHAIGGMAAFIPTRRDPEVNAKALAKVRRTRRASRGDGFDGSWVAHPDLVPICHEVFDSVLGATPNQLAKPREDVASPPRTCSRCPAARDHRGGFAQRLASALRYLAAGWAAGRGGITT